MKFIKPLYEKKPKGAPDFHHSDAPDAEGRFRDLGIKDLAAWLIKTRKKDVKKISGSLTQQVVFNRNDDPEYAEKMEKVRKEVYKQLGRQDLLDKMDEAVESVDEKKVWILLNPGKGYVRKIAVNDYTKRQKQAAKWKDIKSATKAGKEFTKYHGVDVIVQAIDEAINEKKKLPKEIKNHKDIPSWARYVAQHSDGEWTWYEETPTMIRFRSGGGAWKQDGNQTYTGVKTDGKDWDKIPTYYYVKNGKISESVLNEEDSYNDYPAAAKKNAQMAIDWKEKYGRDEVPAGTPVGWARAHQLAKGEKISADTVKRMSAFNRHRKNSKISPEHKDTPWKDNGYVAWLIWGGDEGVDWAMEKSKEIDAMKEAKQFKHIKPLYESLGSYEYNNWVKENGKIKYPKWIKVKSKEIIDGGFMDKVYKGEHHYMSIWLGSFDNKTRSGLYAYGDKGKKEFGEIGYKLIQRFWNDITGYTMFFWMGAMAALEVSKHIRNIIQCIGT